ncbi:MAG: DEAD/DEAH box helicase [Deltaproteobacteria bacterium]|nr:DEAD/DEAH box helicase [Deltaproteobacteria bacterium]
MSAQAIAALYDVIQEGCLPGLWSRGVAFARASAVLEESRTDDEIIVRVHVKDRPTSPKVSLWPADEDWYCDCGDRNETCAHVAAAIIAVKNGQLVPKGRGGFSEQHAPHVSYRFSREGGALSFERYIVNAGGEEVLHGTLVGYVGGVSSGRIESRALAVSKEDFAVDVALPKQKRGVLSSAEARALLGVLRECSTVLLDGKPVRVLGKTAAVHAQVVDDGDGFGLLAVGEEAQSEKFSNGMVLVGDALRPAAEYTFESRRFSRRDDVLLVTEVIPELEKKIKVEVLTTRLPRLRIEAPRIVLRAEKGGDGSLTVVPRLVYGNPAIAEVHDDKMEYLAKGEVPRRDRDAEWTLTRRLQTELHVSVGQLAKFQGQAAIGFGIACAGWDVMGSGAAAFAIGGRLEPKLNLDGEGFRLAFATADGAAASPETVLEAWREGNSFVALIGGGYSPLPGDWLERYGERIESWLAARGAAAGKAAKLPAYLVPEVAAMCGELGQLLPDSLNKLRLALEKHEGIPAAPLPRDLRAQLRAYQLSGVNWLAFLRGANLGALLADDMGLGKTLQALCVVSGRTLIVAPTSVLHGWATQIEQFRPGLKYSIYHGAGRELDTQAPVILTTYAILRLDREHLTGTSWDTIVLDEAQTIKNPDSQVAQAAHALRGGFRVALSGTPIENRLDDLWSQFQFLNPGLLGSRNAFTEQFAREPARLRARIRPFLLRRLKREVAPELPARTETVLHCELSGEERELYDALLASVRAEVVAELKAGGGVFKALEVLLRLRQACCHAGLVPGQRAVSSSKLELLVETLQESIALGHRALIFSQWTSYLDLIEPALAAKGIAFERLDGATRNRQEIVDRFQQPEGKAVMLLSLKAGGVGLTLTAADHIFLMDPWWNPAVEDQAADRAHRIGQVNPVLIQRLVAKDTIEDRILILQKKKLEVAGAVLHDSEGAVSITRDDILELLG